MTDHPRLEAILSRFVAVKPHEISTLVYSSSCFFFILSAYFVVLPLRDEGALSLGLSTFPGLALGSLILTLIAAPLSTLIFSLPNLSKGRALVYIHRSFGASLIVFFILWQFSSAGLILSRQKGSDSSSPDQMVDSTYSFDRDKQQHSWFYISVRIGFFLWISLFNLITISSTWARVVDVMGIESGSRLFGFVGAGATLGQVFGSLFASEMAHLGPFLLVVAGFLLELAAQLSKGISQEQTDLSDELSLLIVDEHHQSASNSIKRPPKMAYPSSAKPHVLIILDGIRLTLSSTYLLSVSLFLWLSVVVSSFLYFQKVTIISMTTASAFERRKLFGQLNSFSAVLILFGQMTLTGHIITVAGITFALCAAPSVALLNLVAVAVWPTWIVVALLETTRKVITYVVTRPGRELLFTVVSDEEKYKAKVCIDVIVQRLGDATAAGMFQLLIGASHTDPSTVSLYAVPVCLIWIATALHLGRQRERRSTGLEAPPEEGPMTNI